MRSTDPELRLYYLQWLEHNLTVEGQHPDRSYTDLVTAMFNTEFTWSVPMDDNRLADGMEVRADFAHTHDVRQADARALGPCSFIEVLLGLARRMAFVSGGSPNHWAWQLLINLELDRMWDRLSRSKMQHTRQKMERVMNRTYQPNGVGGFFPLAWPDGDQRAIELWAQLNAYAAEQHSEH